MTILTNIARGDKGLIVSKSSLKDVCFYVGDNYWTITRGYNPKIFPLDQSDLLTHPCPIRMNVIEIKGRYRIF